MDSVSSFYTSVRRFSAVVFLATCLVGCGAPNVPQAIESAQHKLDKGDAKGAISLLEETFKRFPNDVKVMEALGFAHLSGGDAARAGELLNKLALKTQPDFHLYAATAFKKANQPDKAAEAYRLYLLSEPKQAQPWRDLGELLAANGQQTDALTALIKAHDLEPSATLALKIAQLAEDAQNPAQATRYLQSGIKQAKSKRLAGKSADSIEGDLTAELARSALLQKKNLEAERHIKQLERDFPKHAQLAGLKAALLGAPLPAREGAPKAPAKVEAKTEVAKADKKEETKPAAKSEVKADAKTEVKAQEAKPETKLEVTVSDKKPEQTSETAKKEEKPSEVKLAATLENKPAATIEAKAEVKADAKVETPKSEEKAVEAKVIPVEAAPVNVVKPKPVKDAAMIALEGDSQNPARWAALGASKAAAKEYDWAEAAYLEALRLKPADTDYTLAYLEVVKARRIGRDYIEEAERFLAKYPEMPELYYVTARGYRDLLKNNRNASILFKQFIKKFPNHPEVAKVKVELDSLGK